MGETPGSWWAADKVCNVRIFCGSEWKQLPRSGVRFEQNPNSEKKGRERGACSGKTVYGSQGVTKNSFRGEI